MESGKELQIIQFIDLIRSVYRYKKASHIGLGKSKLKVTSKCGKKVGFRGCSCVEEIKEFPK